MSGGFASDIFKPILCIQPNIINSPQALQFVQQTTPSVLRPLTPPKQITIVNLYKNLLPGRTSGNWHVPPNRPELLFTMKTWKNDKTAHAHNRQNQVHHSYIQEKGKKHTEVERNKDKMKPKGRRETREDAGSTGGRRSTSKTVQFLNKIFLVILLKSTKYNQQT